jgi:phosphopantothenoylcysteine decarboxylase/phosphopantothenate--cysteine ligase
MIIANDVSGDVMGGTHNAVHLITSGGEEYLAHADKGVIARGIAARIATMLEGIAS